MLADPDGAPADEVFILGAGFSKAISTEMPTLVELSEGVMSALGLPLSTLRPYGDNLEQWLSHISTDQPWLDDSENYNNRALFLRASIAVRDAIVHSECEATASPPRDWLLRLVGHLAHRQTVVATFNYDVLFERATSYLGLVRTWSDLYGMPLEERYPPGSGRFLSADEPRGSTPTLYKLHGSINWAYGGAGAPTNSRVVLKPSPADRWQSSNSRSPAPRELHLYDDLVPLIVPPTSTKSPYYANMSLRAQWRSAYRSLQTAQRLVIVGFSLLATDLQVRHFLASSSEHTTVTVVNLAEEAQHAVEDALPTSSRIDGVIGPLAIEGSVDAHCGDVVRWGVVPGPQGWDVLLTVNGAETLPAAATSSKPWDTHDDSSSARAWLTQELDRRWPGLTQAPRSDPVQNPANGGHTTSIAYAPTSAP